MKPITVLTIVTAAGKRLETLSKGTIYFLATFCFICIIVCLTQCVPLHKMWDFTGLVEGKCINTTALFYCQPPIFPLSSHSSYSPSTSHVLRQHPDRHLDPRPPHNNASQDPAPKARKGGPCRHLQPRRLQLHRFDRAPTFHTHLHRVQGPILR
jgi:hypothetical protein